MLATFLKSLVQCVNSHRFICLKGGRKTGELGWLLVEPDRHDVSNRLVEEIQGLDPPGQLLEQQLPLLLHLGQHLTVLVGPAHAPVAVASYSINTNPSPYDNKVNYCLFLTNISQAYANNLKSLPIPFFKQI